MNIQEAAPLARRLAALLRPHCERIEVAGSIRRGKPDGIKDVELVAIPLIATELVPSGHDLFAGELGRAAPRNHLYDYCTCLGETLRWVKGFKPSGKYWQGELQPQGLKLDLFLTTESQWGAILLIRTGSAAFSQEVVTYAHRVGKRFEDGHLRHADGPRIPTPTEESVFEALGLQYVEPERRTGREALRVARRAA